MHTIAQDIFSLYLMNDILMEIVPEAVANTIFKLCIHPVADAFIHESLTSHLRPCLDEWEEANKELHEWEASDDPVSFVIKSCGYIASPNDYGKLGVALKEQINYWGSLYTCFFEKLRCKRQLYCDSDEEDEYTDFIQNYL